MVDDKAAKLIRVLEELSPMPDDGDPTLTIDRLNHYNEVIEHIHNEVDRLKLEGSNDARFVKPLIRSFGYGDGYESYWSTLSALEKFPPDILLPALHEGAISNERGVRMWCIYMLGRQRQRSDLGLLLAALKDPEYKVRYNALQALSMIGDLSAKTEMEELLKDPIQEVRDMAKKSIDALIMGRYAHS